MTPTENRAFLRGVAYAAAYLIRERDEPTYALELLHACGSIKDFEQAEVDEYDMVELRKVTEDWKRLSK